jgi:hypothetical protein
MREGTDRKKTEEKKREGEGVGERATLACPKLP